MPVQGGGGRGRVDEVAQTPTQRTIAARMVAGVTQAATSLRNLGALEYHRGNVTVVNGALLERSACECYRATRDAFEFALLVHDVSRTA